MWVEWEALRVEIQSVQCVWAVQKSVQCVVAMVSLSERAWVLLLVWVLLLWALMQAFESERRVAVLPVGVVAAAVPAALLACLDWYSSCHTSLVSTAPQTDCCLPMLTCDSHCLHSSEPLLQLVLVLFLLVRV